MSFAARRLFCSAQRRCYATSLPKGIPEPRPFQPRATSERITRPSKVVVSPSRAPQKRDLLHRREKEPRQPVEQTKDISQGMAAARKVVSDGYLDPRYRPTARRVIAIIVSLPIVIVFGWELLHRWAETISEQRAEKEAAEAVHMNKSDTSHS